MLKIGNPGLKRYNGSQKGIIVESGILVETVFTSIVNGFLSSSIWDVNLNSFFEAK